MIDPELRDPDYWKKMRRRFLKLDPEWRLSLHWSYFPAGRVGQKHYFRPHCGKGFELIEADFSSLCARAGRVTGSLNPVHTWMLRLWERDNGNGSTERLQGSTRLVLAFSVPREKIYFSLKQRHLRRIGAASPIS
jgi:hypothetical protein